MKKNQNQNLINVGDIIKITNDAPLSGNTVAPPVTIGDEYPVLHTITDSKGHQHIDIGIKSEYMSIKSWETGEELPDGDKIHWVSPWRVIVVVKNHTT